MKKLIFLGWVAVIALPAQAQLFSSESLGSAALGGLVGGIIGHNNGNRTAEGVGIGAGAGLVLGALMHNDREERPYYTTPVQVSPAPVYYSPAPVYYAPSPVYYAPSRPSYALSGAAIGGIAGGVIGHNNGGRTLEGVAIGAGSGLVLGSIAEQNARRRERIVYAQPVAGYYATSPAASAPAAPVPVAPVQQPTQPPPSINNYPGSSASSGPPTAMSQANGLFGR